MAALHALRRVFVSFLCQGIVTVKSSAAKAAGPAPTEPASKSKGTKRSADEVNRADIASDRARSLLEQFQSQLLAGLHAKPAPVRVSRIFKLLCVYMSINVSAFAQLASLRTLMELIRRTPAKRLDTVAASSGAVDVTFRFGDDVFIKVLQRMVSIFQLFRLLVA